MVRAKEIGSRRVRVAREKPSPCAKRKTRGVRHARMKRHVPRRAGMIGLDHHGFAT